MLFFDTTGFFSLICLLVQCGLAWVFAAFFAALARQHGAWLRSWLFAFVGLGLGLLALTFRFLYAHHAAAGVRPLQEGEPVVRFAYAVYGAGKVAFVCGLLDGIARSVGRVRPVPQRWLPWCLVVGAAIGAAVPTVEMLLLLQALWTPWAFLCAQRWLRANPGEERESTRTVLLAVLRASAVVWIVYGVAVFAVGPVRPDNSHPLAILLRLNSMVDLGLQVVLATCLIILVLAQTQRSKVEALRELDRLRDQVQRDERARALATLVGGIAHEINNPLTAILGHANDLEASDPALRARAAAIVREQTERCRQIVQRMSKLGGVPTDAREVDVDQIVAAVVRDLQPRVQAAGVALQWDVPRLLPTWVADPDGLELVLRNLLANAIEASPRDGVVGCTMTERSEGVAIVVTDHGPGVAAAIRARVFDPFFTTKHAGAGLGLAVVEAVVRAHGGRVAVGDAPGGGAQFTVVWPWRPVHLVATPVPTAASTAGAAEPTVRLPASPHDQPRLLVIDDEPLVRATIVRQARAEGFAVVEAESGKAGLELLLAPGADFVAVVCDMRMPGVSGAEFHDQLLQQAPSWLQRLLFITGDLASTESVAFAARSLAPILTKPFTATDLLRRVRALSNVG
ncbi:MAG: hybrid sensor histidine kinase/response regulator [Planctomycetes bacterium]|nr:hybrid sensor histidine kinase/response regulator [Planctomycetota bacterium]